MDDSVVAVVDAADYQSQHLAIDFPERGGAGHDCSVEGEVRFEACGVKGMDLKDVIHPTARRIEHFCVARCEGRVGIVFVNTPDPGQESLSLPKATRVLSKMDTLEITSLPSPP